MTGRLDYAKAKRRTLGRHGEPVSDAPHRPDISLRGWRTEWPEEFPVTMTKVRAADLGEPESEAA